MNNIKYLIATIRYLFVTMSSQISTECSLMSASLVDHFFNKDTAGELLEKLPGKETDQLRYQVIDKKSLAK